jgi:hypothetical protein
MFKIVYDINQPTYLKRLTLQLFKVQFLGPHDSIWIRGAM